MVTSIREMGVSPAVSARAKAIRAGYNIQPAQDRVQFGATTETNVEGGLTERQKRFNKAGSHLKGFLYATGGSLIGLLTILSSFKIRNPKLAIGVVAAGYGISILSGVMSFYHKLMGIYQGGRGLLARETPSPAEQIYGATAQDSTVSPLEVSATT